MERGRSFFSQGYQRAAVAAGVREPEAEQGPCDGLLKASTDAGKKVHTWIAQKSPWAGERLNEAAHAAGELENRGFSHHTREFNDSLLRPFKDGTDRISGRITADIQATAKCIPAQDPASAFALWNVLVFWVNIAILVVDLVLPFGNLLVDFLSALLGYLSAYTFHFVFVRQPDRPWMVAGLVLLSLTVTSNLFAGITTLVLIFPAAISFVRAAASAMLMFHGWQLYARLAPATAAAAQAGATGAATML